MSGIYRHKKARCLYRVELQDDGQYEIRSIDNGVFASITVPGTLFYNVFLWDLKYLRPFMQTTSPI